MGIPIRRLEVKFAAYNGELIILKGFQRFFNGVVQNDTRCVNHAWPEEPE